jgi:hypothetical protein
LTRSDISKYSKEKLEMLKGGGGGGEEEEEEE